MTVITHPITGPVSYTHLDVYKRQYIRMSIIRDENNKPCDYRVTDANEVSSTFFGLPLESYIGSLASEKPVSYTHLDVYKRQLHSQALKQFFFSQEISF